LSTLASLFTFRELQECDKKKAAKKSPKVAAKEEELPYDENSDPDDYY